MGAKDRFLRAGRTNKVNPDEITFGELSKEKEELAKYPSFLIPLDVSDIDYKSPPSNSSVETKGELKYIAHIIENHNFDESERNKLDKDFVRLFFEYADSNNINYDKKEINDLLKDFAILIIRLNFITDLGLIS